MCVHITSRAWLVPGLLPSEKLVLIRLADQASSSGILWPSYSSMARDVGLSRRRVMELVEALGRKGHLTVFYRIDERSGKQVSSVLCVLPPDGLSAADALAAAAADIRGAILSVEQSAALAARRDAALAAARDRRSASVVSKVGECDVPHSTQCDVPHSTQCDVPHSTQCDVPHSTQCDVPHSKNLQRNINKNLQGPVVDNRPRGRADVMLPPRQMLAYLDTHLPYEAHSAWLARQSGPCASGAGTVPGSTGAENEGGRL